MELKNCMVWMSAIALLSCNSSDPDPVDYQEEVFPLKFSLLLKEEVFSFPETRGIPPLDITEPAVLTRGDDDPKSLEELCGKIEYIVFKDGDGTPYRNVTYSRDDLDFGVISDQLPRGDYEIIVVAHNSSSASVSGYHLAFDRVTDTFHHAFRLEVEPAVRYERTIMLYRVVSKIEFVSTDLVPQGAKDFSIRLDKHPSALNLSTGHGVIPEETPSAFNYPLAAYVGETDLTHAFFTFVPEGGTSLTASLKAVDTEDAVLRERTVENIQPIVNKIIRYKGRLYNSSLSDDEFTIILDEDGQWSETIENELGD